MQRRQFHVCAAATLLFLGFGLARPVLALSLSDISSADASAALKQALDKGANAAVSSLGVPDGFLGNDKVRIALPGHLNDAAKLLRTFGQGDKVDALVTAMNRAAEAAVPQARSLLVNAVRSMSVSDAKGILAGGETSVTDFFVAKTRAPLAQKFLPIVTEATNKVDLADKYNQVASKAAGLGLVRPEDANIQQYVTNKALDGLYLMISEEEKKIRQNPLGAGSALLGKVFGALQ